MQDPVTGFVYPDGWVERCSAPGMLRLVEAGRAILTADGSVLVRGFTTGTTAAAACAAAVLSLGGQTIESARITLPCGLVVDVPARGVEGTGTASKVPGDYPGDVTAHLRFVAEARATTTGMELVFEEGVGRFARNTPRYKAGDPAVSAPALACIWSSIEEAVKTAGLAGVRVTLRIPDGAVVAEKTLNPRVGVFGGISILGTTGLVEPWDDHLTESTLVRIASADQPVLTTGRTGLRYARLLYPGRDVILIGGKIEESLSAVPGTAILFGLPALILRFINPRVLEGTGALTVEELSVRPEFQAIAEKNLTEFHTRYPHIRVILIDREGRMIGRSA